MALIARECANAIQQRLHPASRRVTRRIFLVTPDARHSRARARTLANFSSLLGSRETTSFLTSRASIRRGIISPRSLVSGRFAMARARASTSRAFRTAQKRAAESHVARSIAGVCARVRVSVPVPPAVLAIDSVSVVAPIRFHRARDRDVDGGPGR